MAGRYSPKPLAEYSTNELKNIVWDWAANGNVHGAWSLDDYRDELERRTGSRLGYHGA